MLSGRVRDRFDAVGLEEIVRKTLSEPRQHVVPLMHVVKRQPELMQPSFLSPKQFEEKDVGDFYEMMVHAWFGGERHPNQALHFGGKVYFANHKPDLVSDTFEYDQKGARLGTTTLLRDFQMLMYLQRQALHPSKRIAHQIFKYAKDKRQDSEEVYSREMLHRNLARNTMYGLDLPLSIMYALWSIKRPDEINNRFDYLCLDEETTGKLTPKQLNKRLNEDHFTYVKASTLHCFFYAPKLMIRALGLNPKWYRVSKRISPERMTIEGNRVRQFPIVSIYEKYPIAWQHHVYSSIKPQVYFLEEFSDSDASLADNIRKVNQTYSDFHPSSGVKRNGYVSSIRKYPDIAQVLQPVHEDKPAPGFLEDKIPF